VYIKAPSVSLYFLSHLPFLMALPSSSFSSTSSRRTTWHPEGGKLYLSEALVARFNNYLACPQCCSNLASLNPKPYHSDCAFIKNQGGKSPPGTTRRLWSCRIAKSSLPADNKRACSNISVSAMISLCRKQLTQDQFSQCTTST